MFQGVAAWQSQEAHVTASHCSTYYGHSLAPGFDKAQPILQMFVDMVRATGFDKAQPILQMFVEMVCATVR